MCLFHRVHPKRQVNMFDRAEVVELADALDSGSSGG